MDNNTIGKKKNTMTNTLINNIGLNEVEKLWVQYGCYKAAEELSKMLNTYISFSTIKYLSQVFSWKRNCNPKSPMYKGVVINKTIPAAYYKHLIFPKEENKNDESNDLKFSESSS